MAAIFLNDVRATRSLPNLPIYPRSAVSQIEKIRDWDQINEYVVDLLASPYKNATICLDIDETLMNSLAALKAPKLMEERIPEIIEGWRAKFSIFALTARINAAAGITRDNMDALGIRFPSPFLWQNYQHFKDASCGDICDFERGILYARYVRRCSLQKAFEIRDAGELSIDKLRELSGVSVEYEEAPSYGRMYKRQKSITIDGLTLNTAANLGRSLDPNQFVICELTKAQVLQRAITTGLLPKPDIFVFIDDQAPNLKNFESVCQRFNIPCLLIQYVS